MSNTSEISNGVVGFAAAVLRAHLPATWRVTPQPSPRRPQPADAGIDGALKLQGPDKARGALLVAGKANLSPRQAADLASKLRDVAGRAPGAGVIVVAPFIGPLARERLRHAGISYADKTGNTWIALARPAVYIEVTGANKDPSPPRRPVQSLKGAKAASIVRALCDWRPPMGTRELARRADTNAGYTSRVLAFLEAEDLVRRGKDGAVADVHWRGLLQRWSQDYSVTTTNRSFPVLAPRGVSELANRLRQFSGRYALTGSLAVPEPAAVGAPRLASCYVRGAEFAVDELGLRPTDTGANVLLLEPFEDVVFERMREANGLRYVAPSQCVVDLLTGSGRQPAEADALMTWMAEHERAWRL